MNHHLTENQLIDFVLGNLNQKEHCDVSEHLSDCEQCKNELNSWQTILGETENLQPSAQLKVEINKEIERLERKKKRKAHRIRSVKRYVPVLMAILLGFSLILYEKVREPNASYQVSQHEEIIQDDIDYRSEIDYLEIQPVHYQQNTGTNSIEGKVWYDPLTRKMLVEMDSLTQLSHHDFQMWVVDAHNLWSNELLQIENGEVKIFHQGNDVDPFEWLKLSVEPKGGSNSPTGPEAFMIDLSSP